MTAGLEALSELACPYGPASSIEETIERLNRIHHAFEAATYDAAHREIFEALPPLWSRMMRCADELGPGRTWRILDYGCGTGFEAGQAIQGLGAQRIASLTCYDPSPEMLNVCRERVQALYPSARFIAEPGVIGAEGASFDLLLTNSLLHHLVDIRQTLGSLLPLLTPDAVWLAGHEPSSRFYLNDECVRVFRRFRSSRYWQPGRYWRRLMNVIGMRPATTDRTADEAVRQGVFARRPPAWVVGRLVDAWVAHSPEEARAGRGLDYQTLERDFAGYWSLEWVRTYSFMGDVYEGRLARRWKRAADELAHKFPQDGANFCAVWRRRPSITPGFRS